MNKDQNVETRENNTEEANFIKNNTQQSAFHGQWDIIKKAFKKKKIKKVK
jgi:hypothetical protein